MFLSVIEKSEKLTSPRVNAQQRSICRIILHLMKASYAIVNSCDELIVAEKLRDQISCQLCMVSLVLIGSLTIELNTLKGSVETYIARSSKAAY